jgi:catechol 2,3-dioxygenase-like lactoylglutathione lyase family enzyme
VLLYGAGRGLLRAVTTLHHLALGTQRVEVLACFYREVLELPELTRHLLADGSLRAVWLSLGGAVLMIELSLEPPRRVEGVGAGPFLIALAASRGEQTRFEQKLADADSLVESRTDWTIYARDPDGNRIALSAYPIEPAR